MKNLIITLIIGLAAISSGFMFIQKGNSSSPEASTLGHPKKDALEDIKNNDIKLLSYGMPASFQHKKLKDSLSQLLGIKYEAMAGCELSEELVNYVQVYNKLMKKQLEKKLGKNWEQCLQLQIQMQQNNLLRALSAEELASRHQISSVDLYFEKEQTNIEAKDLVIIEANTINFHQFNSSKNYQYKIKVKAFHGKDEPSKIAKKRLQNTIDQIKAFGISANNIEVLGIEAAQVPNCEKCPLNFEGYAQRVELKLEE